MENEKLTEAEQEIFKDYAILMAYSTWATTVKTGNKSKKAFLMRIRFFLQQGKLP